MMYFNGFWTTTELYGTKQEDICDFATHAVFVSRTHSLLVWALMTGRKI